MIRATLALCAAALCADAAVAAAPGCPVPRDLPIPHAEVAPADQPARVVPITGYTLAMVWAPQHCFRPVGGAEALTCGSDIGKGFVLHGLWPDGEGKNWPQWCSTAPILPSRTIAAHYCATPSAQLLQHEWAKHGTCIPGATPDRYFARAGHLYHRLRFPDMRALARTPLTEAQFATIFAAANRGVKPDDIRLNLDREGWLQEVWLCLDTAFRSKRCAVPPQSARTVQIRL